ncbi:MAG: acetoacetate--CoA ligase, partial [Actinobacteria bacterium]|nr:acetoacetate--CoA ligase [Actinomycetota bacterium]
TAVLGSRQMPGAEWFPGARLNYAEHALRHATAERPAIVFAGETAGPAEVSWAELCRRVGAMTEHLRGLGVKKGDAVVGYVTNSPEAVVAFLAAASLGAVWSSCAPDLAPDSVVDRLGQLQPVVLFAVDGVRYAGKEHDRSDVVAQLRQAMPSVRHTVWISNLRGGERPPAGVDALAYEDLLVGDAEPTFEQVPFDHPLWALYTSGTTGIPKGIVHGHGGTVLEQLKAAAFHQEIRPESRLFWYTTTGWTMWNIVVSGLLLGATITLYDGSPLYPDPGALWRLADEAKLDMMGASPAYLQASEKAGLVPSRHFDLSALESLGMVGAPLPLSGYRWVYDNVGEDVFLAVGSGGTDVCSGLVCANVLLPVRAGEIQAPALGVRAEAWDAAGTPVVGEVGELVVTQPMPSMPLHFWNDPDGRRYHDAYFDVYPGVWRQGDWMTVHASGGVTIHGRSDATLNRDGVRMGTAEIYQTVEALPEVAEALVVGAERPDGAYFMPLFVALSAGAELDDRLRGAIEAAIRTHVSPRHVPDEIVAVPGIPHTLTGKKLEVPLKQLFLGRPIEQAVNLGAVDRPDLVRHLADLATAYITNGSIR